MAILRATHINSSDTSEMHKTGMINLRFFNLSKILDSPKPEKIIIGTNTEFRYLKSELHTAGYLNKNVANIKKFITMAVIKI
jgi:hypothetical protein